MLPTSNWGEAITAAVLATALALAVLLVAAFLAWKFAGGLTP